MSSDSREKNSPPRFISWSAVSSEPQAKLVSLDEQQQANHSHIAQHNGVIVAELTIPGQSRDIVLFEDACQRIDAYAQLRQIIADRGADVLICLNRSRLGRTLALVETIVELCRRAGIQVYETENPPATLEAPTASMDSMLLGAIKSAGAQQEIEQIRYRHRTGMIGRIKRGDFASHLPWGYKYQLNTDGDKTVVIDESVAEIIRYAFIELYLERGWGGQRIAAEMNRRGVKTARGHRWSRHTFGRMVRRPWRYAGYVDINYDSDRPYVRARGNHPAIINEDELRRIEDELELRAADNRPEREYLFSLCVWCARCNVRMSWNAGVTRHTLADGAVKDYPYRFARCENQHPNWTIYETRIRRAVEAFVDSLQDDAYREAVLSDAESNGKDSAQALAEIEQQIADARAAIHRADDAYADGVLDAERYHRQINRLESRLDELRQDADQVRQRQQDAQHQERRRERVIELTDKGRAMLEHDDITAANAFWRRHIRIWTRDGDIAIEAV